jgi:hypothetical protein
MRLVFAIDSAFVQRCQAEWPTGISFLFVTLFLYDPLHRDKRWKQKEMINSAITPIFGAGFPRALLARPIEKHLGL